MVKNLASEAQQHERHSEFGIFVFSLSFSAEFVPPKLIACNFVDIKVRFIESGI